MQTLSAHLVCVALSFPSQTGCWTLRALDHPVCLFFSKFYFTPSNHQSGWETLPLVFFPSSNFVTQHFRPKSVIFDPFFWRPRGPRKRLLTPPFLVRPRWKPPNVKIRWHTFDLTPQPGFWGQNSGHTFRLKVWSWNSNPPEKSVHFRYFLINTKLC